MKMTVFGLVLTLGLAGLMLPLLVVTPKEAKQATIAATELVQQSCAD